MSDTEFTLNIFSDISIEPTWKKSRIECEKCEFALSNCICDEFPKEGPLNISTHVIVLQHPEEAKVKCGTVKIAKNAINIDVIQKSRLSNTNKKTIWLQKMVDARKADAYVVFPGRNAIDLSAIADDSDKYKSGEKLLILIFIDSTWDLAKRMYKNSPVLKSLPSLSFEPSIVKTPQYHMIRKEPRYGCMSTLEAIAECLGRLESPVYSEALLKPQKAMITKQAVHLPQAHLADRQKFYSICD